jgi:putative transposase
MAKSSSALFQITKGELVNYQGQEYVLLKVLDLNKVLAQNIVIKNTEVLEIRDLTPWVVNQVQEADKTAFDLTDIPEEEWQFARERLKIIEPLLSRKVSGATDAEAIAKQAGYGVATIYRWVRAFKNSGLLSDLLSDKPGWQTGKWRANPEVEAIIVGARLKMTTCAR